MVKLSNYILANWIQTLKISQSRLSSSSKPHKNDEVNQNNPINIEGNPKRERNKSSKSNKNKKNKTKNKDSIFTIKTGILIHKIENPDSQSTKTFQWIKEHKNYTQKQKNELAYEEMGDVDYGPGHAGRASEEAEEDEPREEQNQNVCSPNPRVREPLCVPVQIRRRNRPNVHLLFLSSSSSFSFSSSSFLFSFIYLFFLNFAALWIIRIGKRANI